MTKEDALRATAMLGSMLLGVLFGITTSYLMPWADYTPILAGLLTTLIFYGYAEEKLDTRYPN